MFSREAKPLILDISHLVIYICSWLYYSPQPICILYLCQSSWLLPRSHPHVYSWRPVLWADTWTHTARPLSVCDQTTDTVNRRAVDPVHASPARTDAPWTRTRGSHTWCILEPVTCNNNGLTGWNINWFKLAIVKYETLCQQKDELLYPIA